MTTTTETIAQITTALVAEAIANIAPAATYKHGMIAGTTPELSIYAGGRKIVWMTAGGVHVLLGQAHADYIATYIGTEAITVELRGKDNVPTVILKDSHRAGSKIRRGERGDCGEEHSLTGACPTDKC